MVNINRKCSICSDFVTLETYQKHADEYHPDYFVSNPKSIRSPIKLLKKEYFNPINNQWYSQRVKLARFLRENDISNEQYYLEFGEKYMPNEWKENSSDPVLNDARNHNKCLECETVVPFDEGHWYYNAFCGFSCSTNWYAKNTDRVERAMKTTKQREQDNPVHFLRPTQLNYWIVKKGMTKEEAKQQVKERQTTNSLEAFIKRADGDKEKGQKQWSQRQEKWLNSLEKRGWFGNHSAISKKLFDNIKKQTGLELRYGDNEITIRLNTRFCKPDCTIAGTKKIIEFFGDYWHANPNKYSENDTIRRLNEGSFITAKEIWTRDNKRLSLLREHGFDILVIWEDDYRKNPEEITKKCSEFFIKAK